jgi:quercetin dioxygenase-like cupin family protein
MIHGRHAWCGSECGRGARAALAGIVLAALASVAPSAATDRAAASDAVVAQLIARDLIGVPGKEVTLETVEYAPGGKSPPHRHHAQVFVYVLEGSLRMQVQGMPTETLGPGGTFYESPDDVHVVSENASQTKPAKFLVVMVKDKAPTAGGMSPPHPPAERSTEPPRVPARLAIGGLLAFDFLKSGTSGN